MHIHICGENLSLYIYIYIYMFIDLLIALCCIHTVLCAYVLFRMKRRACNANEAQDAQGSHWRRRYSPKKRSIAKPI